MEIVVRQISGLGNQLFQYAAGRYYSKKYGATMRVVTEPQERAHSYGHPRPFLLTKFKITAPSNEITGYDRLLLSKNRILGPILSIMKRAVSVQVIREPWNDRYLFHRELVVAEGTRTVFLVGYWQVHTLADAIASELRSEFQLIDAPEGANHDVQVRIQRTHAPVSLHIRRGDYTHPSEGNVALPLSYYLKSIRTMQEKLIEPTFFVFSDDIAYAKEHLPRDIDLVFVEHNDSLSAHEDLRLMSLCQHHIIANSTLSWWGAWLNPYPEKIVIAPKRWRVGGCTETPNLFPTEWVLLDE